LVTFTRILYRILSKANLQVSALFLHLELAKLGPYVFLGYGVPKCPRHFRTGAEVS